MIDQPIYDCYINLGHELIAEIPAADDEPALFEGVVKKIAAHFPYSHIFIFLVQKRRNAHLCCRIFARRTAAGPAKFHTRRRQAPCARYYPGASLRAAQPTYSNDVRKDSYYLPHPSFHDTRSELAAPIRIEANVVEVLDIQDRRRGAFLAQDKEIMEILADHVGQVIDNVTSLQQIVRSVARRFMSHHQACSNIEGYRACRP